MNKTILTLAMMAMSAGLAAAQAPLWLRNVKISPDGRELAFTYKGDIYVVDSKGGDARRLTYTDDAVETAPVWSPDGSRIAFAGDRHGSYDVFVVPSKGGSPRRLTSHSASETPEAFSPDGREVYFSAAIQDPAASVAFPSARLTELYAVPADGGAVRQVLATPAQRIDFAPDGRSFVYQDVKGMENEWRKHHVSSVTRGLWRYDLASGRHTPLVDHAGEDRDPVIDPSGDTLYFLSERDGSSMNVYSVPLGDTSATPVALTEFAGHPVRFLSGASDGTLAFGYDGEIYTLAPGGRPARVDIKIVDADYQTPDFIDFSSGAQEAVPSPDGKQIAFVRRGDIFVTSVDYKTTRQVTSTPWSESSPSWADGGRSLYYVSRENGRDDIYVASMDRAGDPDMTHATGISVSRLLPEVKGVERSMARVSPDGTRIAYVRNRGELVVADLTTKKETLLAHASLNPERDGMQYRWSPDSKWIVFTAVPHHHSPYYDIALVNADGSAPEVTLITETGYFEELPRFSPDGKAVIWLSERNGMRNHASWGTQYDVMAAFLTREAYDSYRLTDEEIAIGKNDRKEKTEDKAQTDGEQPAVRVEREGIADRVVRLTPYSSDIADAILTADGEKLYYLSRVEKGHDLWRLNLRKGDIAVVKKLAAGGDMSLEQVGDDIFLLSSGSMKKMDKGEKLTSVSYSGRMKVDPAAEREHMLEYVRTEEAERFYTPDMHGVEWHKLVDHYRRFLPHINNNADFSIMLSELLGELNVSHTGSGYRPEVGADEVTAELGLLYDWTYKGDGLRIAEVLAGGPVDRASSAIKPGDVIKAVNGRPVSASADFLPLLNGLGGKRTLLTVESDTHGRFDEVVKPISRARQNELLYARWVKNNAARVDSLSSGRLGYVHIQSMADPSFRTMYADVLGKYNDRDGIVIDTRWNGGGRMHEDIEVLFSGRKYLTQKVRGEETASMPSRRWNKPSIMLICEANYSNAHGTPWVYSTMGLGKLVGMPVPGTMTSVNWVDLQDPTMYFGIPIIGYELPDGSYLENKQLEPDIRVANAPERIAAGIDDQLETAVRALLEQIDAQK